MMSKSICIVSAQYKPHVGGVEQYVENFSKELVRLGNSVTLITSSAEGLPFYQEDEGIKIYRLPSFQLMNGRFPVLKHNRKLIEFTKTIMAEKFDVMLINTRFYTLSLYGVRLAGKMKIRSIILDHGTGHLNTGGKITTKLGEAYEHAITWIEKRYCKEFAGVSRATLGWLRHFHIKSDLVLYNSIDVNEFNDLKEGSRENYRKRFNIPQDDILISFVGRLTVEKGIEELTRAVARVNKAGKTNVWLIAAGDGYLYEKMNQIKNNNIFFVGQIGKEDVAELLAESDIFCLPSVSEGFPTTVLEAAVSDNFIISTYNGGTKELIKDSRYGIILPDNSSEGIYKALIKVLEKKEYRKSAAKMCYDRVVNTYTWNYTVKKFLDFLNI
ncbi:MAG: glycosyltransferase family 4 protein [Lachnospiraceae bacterium]